MLQKLIVSLSKEEIRHHKLLLKAIKRDSARLDTELFDFLKKNGEKENAEQNFRETFYPKSANPYYRLKNRVMHQVFKNLLHLHNGDDQHHEVLEGIEASRIFYKKESYELCEYFLRKAEKKALKLDDFDYLNIIYRELIKLSYERHSINPAEIIEKQKLNQQKQSKIRELNNVLAIVSHQLKRTQNLGKGNVELNRLLEETVNRYANDKQVINSYQFQYSIYQAFSQHFLRKQDWKALSEYVKERYDFFIKKGLFTKNNHEAKLQMLTYLVNAAFKNNDLNESLTYTEQLYDQMLLHNRIYYHKYLFFYYQALVMNWSVSNPAKAISVLHQIKDDKAFVSNSYYVQFILANLGVLHLQSGDYQDALNSIDLLFKSEHYQNFESELKIQIHLFKLIVIYELEEFDQVLKLLIKLENEFKDLGSALNWVSALKLLANRDEFKVSNALKNKVKDIVGLNEGEIGTFFAFNDWILNKLD